MRNLILLLVAVALTGGAGVAAFAGNTTSGAATDIACTFGSCFVPDFPVVGSSVSYVGPAASRVEFADCCLSGDKIKVLLKRSGAKSTTIWTSSGTLTGVCTDGPYLQTLASEIGATSAKMTLVASAATPAGAYIRMSAGSWVRTSGSDECGK